MWTIKAILKIFLVKTLVQELAQDVIKRLRNKYVKYLQLSDDINGGLMDKEAVKLTVSDYIFH